MTTLLLSTYDRFFKKTGFGFNGYEFVQEPICLEQNEPIIGGSDYTTLNTYLHNISSEITETTIIPIKIRYNQSGNTSFYVGIGYQLACTNCYYMHHLCLPDCKLKFTPLYYQYLDELMNADQLQHCKSVRELASDCAIGYQRFQDDCKFYFRDTFHQFLNKLRMLKALEDIVLSDLSLKEIAYHNHFTGYNNMSFLYRRYQLSLPTIPRIFDQFSL
ncbi:helix-turn-helix domain-containing protein [Pedobacter sp. KLB.chiD]|uniref:helix-turn-helix domain-containing protein n=1 Tax=Pedobacter sp. KLB.chiD TaxID=3387402 RepID=UPI00399B9B75